MSDREKIGFICFDDLDIDDLADLDVYLDQLVGPAKQGFLLMIRGASNWKYPYMVDHDIAPTAEVLDEVLRSTEALGIKIFAITCDQGTLIVTREFLQKLKIKTN